MLPFQYKKPSDIDEALQQFSDAGDQVKYIAGGTTLYDLMKLRIEDPTVLIDVSGIQALHGIETHGQNLRFGGLARMSDIASNVYVNQHYPVLVEALQKAASQQLRNMATIGGNLLQRTRCPYFRNGAGSTSTVAQYPCNKSTPGSGCAAKGGIGRNNALLGQSSDCCAVFPGDWPIALSALNATIELVGINGPRVLSIEEFYRLPGDSPQLETNIEAGEIIASIVVPKTTAGINSTYHKIRDRESYAFALVSAAVALKIQQRTITQAHIALGGVATKPWRCLDAEKIVEGQSLTYELALEAGRTAFADAVAGTDNAFKIELGVRTVADALMIAGQRGQ